MRWNLILGTMVAVGALAATEVRAQGSVAESGMNATTAQQGDAAGNPSSDDAQPKAKSTRSKSKTSAPTPYGAYVEGPSTVDADGVPVAKPNPMSRFKKRSRAFDNMPVEMPLVDDPRDGPAPDQQAK
jgi:hypothetical protein